MTDHFKQGQQEANNIYNQGGNPQHKQTGDYDSRIAYNNGVDAETKRRQSK